MPGYRPGYSNSQAPRNSEDQQGLRVATQIALVSFLFFFFFPFLFPPFPLSWGHWFSCRPGPRAPAVPSTSSSTCTYCLVAAQQHHTLLATRPFFFFFCVALLRCSGWRGVAHCHSYVNLSEDTLKDPAGVPKLSGQTPGVGMRRDLSAPSYLPM